MPAGVRVDHWYFLNGVDVLANHPAGGAVMLGDSITDGRNSTTNGNGRWPDDLARRLQARKGTKNVAVLNEGIGGNRVLHDGLGPKALARMGLRVFVHSGGRWRIGFEGRYDVGTRVG